MPEQSTAAAEELPDILRSYQPYTRSVDEASCCAPAATTAATPEAAAADFSGCFRQPLQPMTGGTDLAATAAAVAPQQSDAFDDLLHHPSRQPAAPGIAPAFRPGRFMIASQACFLVFELYTCSVVDCQGLHPCASQQNNSGSMHVMQSLHCSGVWRGLGRTLWCNIGCCSAKRHRRAVNDGRHGQRPHGRRPSSRPQQRPGSRGRVLLHPLQRRSSCTGSRRCAPGFAHSGHGSCGTARHACGAAPAAGG
jgi:hypothetical protein